MKIKFKKLTETAIIPKLNNQSDAGLDFFSDENIIIPAKGSAICTTGIAWQPILSQTQKDLNFKAYMQMQSRSGMAFKNSIELTNAGVIDESYRGNIGLKFYNNESYDYFIAKGEKVAQGIVKLIPIFEIEEVKELENTVRGTNGFGSSGKL